MLIRNIALISCIFLAINLCDSSQLEKAINGLSKVRQVRDELARYFDPNANWCCKIDPPPQPVFNNEGHLLGYIPSACKPQYKVCCRTYINIVGYCIRLEEVKVLYPQWDEEASAQGISLLEFVTNFLMG